MTLRVIQTLFVRYLVVFVLRKDWLSLGFFGDTVAVRTFLVDYLVEC